MGSSSSAVPEPPADIAVMNAGHLGAFHQDATTWRPRLTSSINRRDTGCGSRSTTRHRTFNSARHPGRRARSHTKCAALAMSLRTAKAPRCPLSGSRDRAADRSQACHPNAACAPAPTKPEAPGRARPAASYSCSGSSAGRTGSRRLGSPAATDQKSSLVAGGLVELKSERSGAHVSPGAHWILWLLQRGTRVRLRLGAAKGEEVCASGKQRRVAFHDPRARDRGRQELVDALDAVSVERRAGRAFYTENFDARKPCAP